MSVYSISDDAFIKSNLFKQFKAENPSYGYLRIRAYSANEAYPISDLNVVISTKYISDEIIFFQGKTNDSGVIDKIPLPTPINDTSNLIIPKTIEYQIKVSSEEDNINANYVVKMYDGVCSVQNISIGPQTLKVGVIEWQ